MLFLKKLGSPLPCNSAIELHKLRCIWVQCGHMGAVRLYGCAVIWV